MRTHAHWCNAIADDGTASDCNCSVGKMVQAPDLTTLERDVVTAAVNLNADWERCGMEGEPTAMAQALTDAVHALREARKPQGVKPSEVEPGTRFTWLDGSGDCTMVMGKEPLWFDADSDFPPCPFRPDALIIPLNPQEPV